MNSPIDKVGLTAFIIAAWRMQESEQADCLFIDHIANIFIDGETLQRAEHIDKISPSTRRLVMQRTKYFDDLVLEYAKKNYSQIVILGSGLDTRPLRLGISGVNFFEIDKDEVIIFKRERLKTYGYVTNSVFCPCDYTETDFLEAIKSSGFDTFQKTALIWEGNTMYVAKEDVLKVLKSIRTHVREFIISFDYLSKKIIKCDTSVSQSAELVDQFAGMGAPWITGFECIDELAVEADLKVVENMLLVDMLKKQDASFNSSAFLWDDYSIATFANA